MSSNKVSPLHFLSLSELLTTFSGRGSPDLSRWQPSMEGAPTHTGGLGSNSTSATEPLIFEGLAFFGGPSVLSDVLSLTRLWEITV